MMEASIELRAKHTLAITPRLQQAVHLLQLSSAEFSQELRHAVARNPFLEYDDLQEVKGNNTDISEAFTASNGNTTERVSDRQDGDYALANVPPPAHIATTADTTGVDWLQSPSTLRELLYKELCSYPLNERDRMATQIIIESLDEDGYLRESIDQLVSLIELVPPFTESELRVALKLVQKLSIPGIGARTLSECLTLQLEAMPTHTPGRELALALVTDHLDTLARREHAKLQRQLQCNASELHTACALLQKLVPKPGGNYGRNINHYIMPDVIIQPDDAQKKRQWIVTINPSATPCARLHQRYAELFAQTSGARNHSPLAQQLQEARWLIHSTQQRFRTIQRVAECIVSHQKTFFDYGEIAMKPLALRDVSQALDLHESTISRATSNKYMATPRGIFAFKHFFPRELSTQSGGSCSATAVRSLLKEFIRDERKDAPLSDVTLTKLLAQQGVIIARRTVAKYRQLMKVPAAELRRQR